MIFIYIHTIFVSRKRLIPYHITICDDTDDVHKTQLIFRPEMTIPKQIYDNNTINRHQVLSALPFSDIADELIDIFENNELAFSDMQQFRLLKSQFKIIGYNFELKPVILWHKVNEKFNEQIEGHIQRLKKSSYDTIDYSERYIDLMITYHHERNAIKKKLKLEKSFTSNHDLSDYKIAAGVYFFLNQSNDIVYVGKAKNIRKRLQSHFSNSVKASNINYSDIKQIQVEYTGNDIIAQLVESEHIKSCKPVYNVQQISDPKPFIINLGTTVTGIIKLKITRKDIEDNLPERYFNRESVKLILKNFCNEHDLCRKHCGVEHVKGPCSKYVVNGSGCVCSGDETIDSYNQRFSKAFQHFKNRKSRKIYKLKGRNLYEDAFIYMVNGIYEGYGFIQKDETISNVNDILGHLNVRPNNYETSRIVGNLSQIVSSENIIILSH